MVVVIMEIVPRPLNAIEPRANAEADPIGLAATVRRAAKADMWVPVDNGQDKMTHGLS